MANPGLTGRKDIGHKSGKPSLVPPEPLLSDTKDTKGLWTSVGLRAPELGKGKETPEKGNKDVQGHWMSGAYL